jgi:hypothetical protein
MAYDPLNLSDGTIINPTFIKDYDAGHSYDYNAPLQKAGYLQTENYDKDYSWINENYGTNFQSGDAVRDYIYGTGGTYATDQNGTRYYKPVNGIEGTVNTPFEYFDNSMDFGDYTLMGMMALGGAGLAGALPGTTSIFGGAATGAGAGATAGSAMPVGSAFGSGAGLTAEGLGTFGSIGTGGSALGGAGSIAGGAGIGGGVDFLSSIGSVMDAFGTGAMPSLSGSTFGSIPMGSFGWESFMPGGNLAGSTSSGSIWDSIGSIFGNQNPVSSIVNQLFAPREGEQPDYLKMLGALGSFMTQKDLADKLSQISQQQDPFRSQRGFYQDILKQSYSDPNFLQNNPTFRAMYDPALRQVNANMAQRGLSNSGNALHEIMRTGTETAGKFMLPFQQQTGQFAGAGINPDMSGQIASLGAQTNQNSYGNLGVVGNELWKLFNQRDPMIMNMV